MKDAILEEFEKEFDIAQKDTEDIESATDDVVERFSILHPAKVKDFKKLIDEKLEWYRNLPDVYDNEPTIN